MTNEVRKINFKFADGSLKSNILPVPASDNERGALAVGEVDLHSDFPTATTVEIRFADTAVPDAALARYEADGTLISFAGAASRQVKLELADYAITKKYAQMVSNTTITTGGICVALLRDV